MAVGHALTLLGYALGSGPIALFVTELPAPAWGEGRDPGPRVAVQCTTAARDLARLGTACPGPAIASDDPHLSHGP